MTELPIIDTGSTNVPPSDTCRGCGLCCLHMSTPPYDEEERELLQENLPDVYADLLAVEATRELQLKSVGTDFVPCGFFDWITRTCRHHDHSPDICGRFPTGDPMCNQFRRDIGWPDIETPSQFDG